MKEILLNSTKKTKYYQQFVTIVDDEDFEKVNKFYWRVHTSSVKIEIKHYVISNILGIPTLLHRLILGANSKQMVDHINRNGLDNRKSNLRFATFAQNCVNKIKNENCSSTFKGVSWYSLYSKWRAYIKYEKKMIHLGYFEIEKDAAMVYNEAAKKYYREFARLNDIANI